jgi:hypothetical protein
VTDRERKVTFVAIAAAEEAAQVRACEHARQQSGRWHATSFGQIRRRREQGLRQGGAAVRKRRIAAASRWFARAVSPIGPERRATPRRAHHQKAVDLGPPRPRPGSASCTKWASTRTQLPRGGTLVSKGRRTRGQRGDGAARRFTSGVSGFTGPRPAACGGKNPAARSR